MRDCSCGRAVERGHLLCPACEKRALARVQNKPEPDEAAASMRRASIREIYIALCVAGSDFDVALVCAERAHNYFEREYKE